MVTSTRGRQYWHDPVGCGRSNVRDMEGLAASIVLIAILLGVLLVVVFDIFCLLHLGKADTAHFLPKFAWAVLIVCTSPIGGLVYLFTQRLPKRSPGAGDHADMAAQAARESVDWDWMDHPGRAHHRTLGGD